jgi:hypothetical protein
MDSTKVTVTGVACPVSSVQLPVIPYTGLVAVPPNPHFIHVHGYGICTKYLTPIFFDEVQNLLHIEPSAFSDLQKHYDINREDSSLLLIFAGSSR